VSANDVAVYGSHIYWSSATWTIGRADLSGANVIHSLISTASTPVGLAVDASHIYWTNMQRNSIGRSDHGGWSPNQDFITGATTPLGVVVTTASEPSPTPTPTATPTPSPTPTPTPTPTAVPTPTPTPTAAVCAPLSEGFDDVDGLTGAGWFMQNNSQPLGTTGWFRGYHSFSAHSGTSMSYIAADFSNVAGAGTISNWLMTPVLALQDGAQLTFYTRTVSNPTNWPDRLQVRMSTNGVSTDAGVWAADVGDFAHLLLDINPTYGATGYPATWTQYTVTITGLGSPTSGRLAFRYFVEQGGPDGSRSEYIGIDTLAYQCQPTPTLDANDTYWSNAGFSTVTPSSTGTATASTAGPAVIALLLALVVLVPLSPALVRNPLVRTGRRRR
jgi:hypothetical protein